MLFETEDRDFFPSWSDIKPLKNYIKSQINLNEYLKILDKGWLTTTEVLNND